MAFEYIQQHYKVPAEYGMEIEFDSNGAKRKGVIVQDLGKYIGVNFHDTKPNVILPLHPKSGVTYLGKVTPRKITRSQRRYMEWQREDCGRTFAEFLGIYKD